MGSLKKEKVWKGIYIMITPKTSHTSKTIKKCITFRIEENKLNKLKEYCRNNNTSIQKILDWYVDELLKEAFKEDILGGGENFSVGDQINTVGDKIKQVYHCPFCGENLTDLKKEERIDHERKCNLALTNGIK